MSRLGLGLALNSRMGLLSIPAALSASSLSIIAHPAYCRSDAANTIPCAAGDAIQWWRDATSGVWSQQATSGLRLILRQDGNGEWYADNDGTKKHSFSDSNCPAGNVSVRIGARYSAPNGMSSSSVFNYGTAASGQKVFIGANSLNQIFVSVYGSGVNGAGGTTGPYRVIGSYDPAGNWFLYKNGTSVSNGAMTTNIVLSSATIGHETTDGAPYVGPFYRGAICGSGVTVTALDAWLALPNK